MREIWFWQRIVSPHMAGLASALVALGCRVTFAAEEELSAERARQGWITPRMPGVRLVLLPNRNAIRALIDAASPNTEHLCQGIRSNGRISVAQRDLARRGLHQWIVMETVDDSGLLGIVKREVYRRQLAAMAPCVSGLLAMGHRTPQWVIERGFDAANVFPFAYFLPDLTAEVKNHTVVASVFRFLFVGQLIQRKHLDGLIQALAMQPRRDFELWVVGSGPEEDHLRRLAGRTLPEKVKWMGRRNLPEIPEIMAQADCLVLPSLHDGWGAVVSEALLVGTPAVCSDACGAAGIVAASGKGGVFRLHDRAQLAALLASQIAGGTVTSGDRGRLASWASVLGAAAGARYLIEILNHRNGEAPRPAPPWNRGQN